MMLSKAQIQTFIDYFSNEQNEFFKWNKPGESRSGVVQLGFIQYDDGVQQFINDLYEADMLDPQYFDHLEKYKSKIDAPADLIPTADLELLKSILTFYVRGEKYSDGVWASAIDEGVFLAILQRLEDIVK
jgi:hypothetical protein